MPREENTMANIQEGGCRCGAARYEVDLTNAHTLNCHCRDCQQHLGAPFSVFSVVPASQLKWLKEPAGTVAFSKLANRLFCLFCGTYLKWEGIDTADEAEINTMTLDNPSAVSVDEEIFTRSRLAWIKPIEGIPQHKAGRSASQQPQKAGD